MHINTFESRIYYMGAVIFQFAIKLLNLCIMYIIKTKTLSKHSLPCVSLGPSLGHTHVMCCFRAAYNFK